MGTLLDQALALAARGLPVFPCGRTKKPCIPKDEGGRGLHDASTDPAIVRALFAARGAALIGAPTGEASGVDVLDIDPRHGGDIWESANADRMPETRTHETMSGGRHWIFQHAPGVKNSASKKGIAKGVDVRGEGGYIIVPPSKGYRVISDAPIAHWPDWLLPLVLPAVKEARDAAVPLIDVPQERIQRVITGALHRVRSASDGSKHFVLRNMALLVGGVADRAALSDAELVRCLVDALPAGVKDIENARKTAAWGIENGRKSPLEISDHDDVAPGDPRRKETARAAFRLLRMGVSSQELLDTLYELNARREQPLPTHLIGRTALWAAQHYAR